MNATLRLTPTQRSLQALAARHGGLVTGAGRATFGTYGPDVTDPEHPAGFLRLELEAPPEVLAKLLATLRDMNLLG